MKYVAPLMVIVSIVMWSAAARPTVPRCKIVGDHEFNTGHCTPYCPPRPSDCG